MAPRPLTDEDLVERRAIDGRVAFAIAGFVALAGSVALLDRVGAPEALVRAMGPLFILAALAASGILLRSMRVSRFYAAGRAVPTPYVGFAAAAICVGLALPFAPPSDAPVGSAVAEGAAVGLVVALLVLGPYLRKTGAFSVVDLVATRFPNTALRLGLAVTVAAIGALIGLAGFDLAISSLSEIAGLPRAAVAAGLAFVLVLAAAPGGVSGLVWAANGAAGTLLAALILPIAVLTGRGTMPMPFGASAPLWDETRRQLLAWQGDVSSSSSVVLAFGAALAVASLAPLITAPLAARDSTAAVRGGGVALGWSAAFAALVSAAVLWGAVLLVGAVAGKAPDGLPDAIYTTSAGGFIDICGRVVSGPAAARKACATRPTPTAPLGSGDVKPREPLVLAGLTSAAGAGAAGVGLLAAGLLATGLAVAAAGFLLCATALGHDLFYRVRNRQAQTSRRLAVTRALLVATVAVGAAIAGARELDARLLISLAATLSAAAILPLFLLSLNPRAIGRDAVIALLVGLVGAEFVLFAQAPTLDVLLRASVSGAAAGFLAGLAASFLTPGDRAGSRAFVDAVLHATGDVLAPDKGA